MQDESKTNEELLLELKELRKSEKLYRFTLSNISDAIFITDNAGVFTFICPNVNVIFGYSFSEVEKMGKISKLLGGDDLLFADELERLGEIRNIEHDICDKSGNIHNLLVNVKKVFVDDGRYLYSCRDITERKKAEKALREAHEDLEIQVLKRTKQLNEANFKLKEEIKGHKHAEEALRESEEKLRLKLDAVFSPDVNIDDEELFNIIDAPLIQSLMDIFTELTGMPSAIKDTKGNILAATGWQDICTHFHRVNPETKLVCIQSDVKDILEAKNLKSGEYKAYKCENGLYDVFTPLFIADKLVANIYTGQLLFEDEDVDESYFIERADKYGFNREEYLNALRRVPRVSRDKVDKTMKYLARFTELISRLSYNNLMLARTIVEKELTEKELTESEAKYRTLVENLHEGIWKIDANANTTFVNESMVEILGYNIEEIMGRSLFEFMDKKWEKIAKEKLEQRRLGLKEQYDFKLIRKDGTKICTTFLASPLMDYHGIYQGSLVSVIDISQRKHDEELIKKSLKEKADLLTEIHHRVKNNLQIISSLLNLQIQNVSGIETKNILMESQGRVKTIAMVHEKLYRSSNFTNINLKEYVKQLSYDILFSYGIKKGTIKLEFDIKDIKINMETAIPCGLIVNELVTNSVKYAFPKLEGNIKIELKSLYNQLKLIVADNGIGIPENIDIEKPETLGLQLVNSLVKQLEGDIKLERSNGTKFKINFKELDYTNRL